MRIPISTVVLAIALFLSLWNTLPSDWVFYLKLFASQALRRTIGGSAPLNCPVASKFVVPDMYIINLVPTYSFVEHKESTGRGNDIQKAAVDIGDFRDPVIGEFVSYEAKINDSSLLVAIREDIGVFSVSCATRVYFDVSGTVRFNGTFNMTKKKEEEGREGKATAEDDEPS